MIQADKCYCGSDLTFDLCCQPFLDNKAIPDSAEKLMRSRYSAYVVANARYIIDTTHPKTRHFHSRKAILQWSKENTWDKLEIILSEANRVVFKAYFKDSGEKRQIHYENSLFEKLGDKWYYVSGTFEE
ncbi:YchJ family protein [Myroides phaeus]|uniref:SEC-C motif-containing protein n=1 Tax=Myroides phaeus TaxID=702745 RepID=A0A1G8G9N3_9FLAO|nr:YchJ family metal-binding protein [Myroides phaeus]MEC4116535.1 YchJ family metal-binding protein [Myroides phaeus]SDH91082.1 SEC-C motif-containing protein [Myroides phaeus]